MRTHVMHSQLWQGVHGIVERWSPQTTLVHERCRAAGGPDSPVAAHGIQAEHTFHIVSRFSAQVPYQECS